MARAAEETCRETLCDLAGIVVLKGLAREPKHLGRMMRFGFVTLFCHLFSLDKALMPGVDTLSQTAAYLTRREGATPQSLGRVRNLPSCTL